MFDDGRGYDGPGDESAEAVRARLGLSLPEDGGPPCELVERLLQLSDDARLVTLGSAELVETAAAFAAVEAWAAAGARAAAARLHESLAWDGRAPAPVAPGRVEVPGAAADELAMRLGVSRRRAARLVGEGRAYEGVLHPVGTALAAGSIDPGKAAAFAELLVDQGPPVCFAVCEQVLPAAPGLTHHALRQRLRAAIIQVDPRTAHERALLAARTRRLEHPHLLADGLASLRLVAPLLDVATVYSAAEAAARAQRASGDPRTLDQLRADAVTTLAADALVRGSLEGAAADEAGLGPAAAGGDGGPASVPGTSVPGASVPGASVPGASVPGTAEPVASVTAPRIDSASVQEPDEFDLLRQADEARLGANTPVGVVERTVGQIVRGLTPSSRRRRSTLGIGGRLPTVTSQMLGGSDDGARGGERPAGSTGPGSGASGADGSGAGRSGAAPFLPFVPFSGATSRLTLAAAPDHLTEPDPVAIHPTDPWAWEIEHGIPTDGSENPFGDYEAPTACRPGIDVPEILGFGPVEPAVARRVAADPPRFVRVSTLPSDIARDAGNGRGATRTGTDARTDAGRQARPDSLVAPPGYVPGAELARRIRTLHPVCVAPACTVPSSACDLDHVVAWPHGPTAEDNLRPLCRHHHRLKTHDGHRTALDPDGSSRWTTPTGYVYVRPPSGTSQLVVVPAARSLARESGSTVSRPSSHPVLPGDSAAQLAATS